MKIMFVFLVCLASLVSCSQNIPVAKVPSVVQNTFKAKFANASKVEWEWEKKQKLFEAEFILNNSEHTAFLNQEGKIVMEKTDITLSELPEAISAALRSDYGAYEIDDMERLLKDGIVYYAVELDKRGEKDKRLIFSADGKIANNVTYL